MSNKVLTRDDNGTYFFPFGDKAPVGDTTVKPGVYTLGINNGQVIMRPMQINTDQLLDLPDTVSEDVVNDILNFWKPESKERFKEFKFLYKRGILMHGKPGAGKTCAAIKIAKEVVKRNGIVFFNPSASLFPSVVSQLRDLQPALSFLVIWEDFEDSMSSDMLALLDGERQVDNVVYIATTNFLDHIPANIKNRPSRFANVVEVGAPSSKAREIYLKHKLPTNYHEIIPKWASKTKGLVLDQIKDLIVSVFCLNNNFDKALNKIKKLETSVDKKAGKLLPGVSGVVSSYEDDFDEEDSMIAEKTVFVDTDSGFK